MPTDDERREVARRLRGDPCDTLMPYKTGIHFGMGCHEAANRFWDMCERIKSAGDYDIAYSTRSVLADLIEPPHQCPYYDSLKHRCSFHDVPAVDRDAERTWHDFADELPPAKKPVLCKGRNGALYVGKPVTFVGGERTREVWVPRGDQYRKPEKWMEIDDD